MKCPVCSHENDGGNFCEQCGAKLNSTAFQETAAAAEISQGPAAAGPQGGQYLEGAKNISKMYFSYFLQVLKQPYASSSAVGAEHFVNGIITIVLYALIIPLTLYFGVKGLFNSVSNSVNEFGNMLGAETNVNITPPFTDMVMKPAFAYAIFILLVATFVFAAVRMGRVNASYKEVLSRFGSFLIPFVAILVIALLMSLLKIKLFIAFILIGFLGSIFIVPPLVIASFKKDIQGGFDVIYGSLLTYILTGIAISILGDMLIESIKSSVTHLFSNLF